MDRIVQSYMDSFLKSQDIVEKNQSKQFEMFSSYCVYRHGSGKIQPVKGRPVAKENAVPVP